jgi:hypothetical protein
MFLCRLQPPRQHVQHCRVYLAPERTQLLLQRLLPRLASLLLRCHQLQQHCCFALVLSASLRDVTYKDTKITVTITTKAAEVTLEQQMCMHEPPGDQKVSVISSSFDKS